jgi:cyanate permease
MNIPFLLTASVAGRLDRQFSPRQVIACGCLVAALGVAVPACLTPGGNAFLAGYHTALAGAAICLLLGGVLITKTCRLPIRPDDRQTETTERILP